jgi:hypothetical protein
MAERRRERLTSDTQPNEAVGALAGAQRPRIGRRTCLQAVTRRP